MSIADLRGYKRFCRPKLIMPMYRLALVKRPGSRPKLLLRFSVGRATHSATSALCFAALLWLFILLSIAGAQYSFFDDISDFSGENAGQSVCTFLTLPVSAYRLGQSAIAAVAAQDATDIPTNPAATAFLTRHSFAVTHLEWILGLRKEYAGACFPVLDVGTLGIFSQVFTLGGFEYARDINEQPSPTPRAIEYTVGASAARGFLHDRLAVGFAGSYLESRLDHETARAFSGAADICIQPNRWIAAGLYARNFGSGLRYIQRTDPQPLQTGISVSVLPLLAADSAGNRKVDVRINLGAQKNSAEAIQLGIGAEAGLIGQFFLRTGYEYDYTQPPGAGGLSAGAGLVIKGYGVDAGWKYQSPEFGSVWSVTIKAATEELTPRTAMDYYRIAWRHFTKERYGLAIRYAKRALRLNPELWEAHDLISKTIAIMRRQKGVELALIYTANQLGQFVPLITEGATLGGLARQAAVIRDLQSQFPLHFSVSGGNMLIDRTHPIKARFTDEYYRLMNYDALALGEREMRFGIARYRKEVGAFGNSFLCSNYKGKAPDIIPYAIVSEGNYRFAICNVVTPSLLDSAAEPVALSDPLRALQELFRQDDIRQCHARILVIHDSWENIVSLLPQLPSVDIALCASLEQKFDAPMKVGEAITISPGALGKYVGALTLRFNEKGTLVSFNNKLIALTDAITPADDVTNLLRALAAKIEMAQRQSPVDGVAKGVIDAVFPFVSNRHGHPGVFLRAPKHYAAFPLTQSLGTICYRPRIHAGIQKILYLEKTESAAPSRGMIMDFTGANKRAIQAPGPITEALFSPDGKWIYFAAAGDTGREDIFRTRAEGGEYFPVIAWPHSAEQEIAISADGAKLLFTADRDGRRHMYYADTAGANPVRISDARADHVQPEFCPSGQNIAFLSDMHAFGGKKDLWLHELATGKMNRLSAGTSVMEFCWIDERRIAYVSGINMYDMTILDIADKSEIKLPSRELPKKYSERRPRSTLADDKHAILYVREYLNGDKDIHRVLADGTNDVRVVASKGADWLD